jgi:hypothetical protein
MGYRSQVVIAIDKEVFISSTVLKKGIPDLLRDGADRTNYAEIKDEKVDVLYWAFEDIKWYENYTDIKQVYELLESLPETIVRGTYERISAVGGEIEEFPLEVSTWGFIRVGEHDDDVETRGSPCDFELYVNTTIDSPLLY